MNESNEQRQFEAVVLPHVDAGYNLARWLTRSPEDAHDIVQEALLRALKYFSGYRGGNPKSWFLAIVRNAWYSFFQRHQNRPTEPLPDDDRWGPVDSASNPETMAQSLQGREQVQKALADLPVEFREIILLREIEGLSYKEISEVVGLPLGTVMSRLSRARARLQESLSHLGSSL